MSATNSLPSSIIALAASMAGPTTILLVGSTGNGKSTFGNFLLDPEKAITGKKQIFETATDNKPKTKVSCKETRNINVDCGNGKPRSRLSVIDTPGLNEGEIEDVKNMTNLMKELQSNREITACVFVVKFNSKIDMQYKNTIKYYASLIPSLFERNVFVVITNYTTDQRSVELRKRQGIDDGEIQENVVDTIVRNAGLIYLKPVSFLIDCIPFSEEEVEASSKTRDAIIDYILSLAPLKLEKFTVAKTEALQRIDNEKIAENEGAITGYRERLAELEKQAEGFLKEVQETEKDLAAELSLIRSLENELSEKDSEELVTAAAWSIHERRKLKSHDFPYEIKSQWEVFNIKKWCSKNSKCEFHDVSLEGNTLKGHVKSSFMSTLHASIALETKKKIRYETEIEELKGEIKKKMKRHDELQSKLNNIKCDQDHCRKLIDQFRAYIVQRREDIIKLSTKTMTIDEALARLSQLDKQ